MSPAQARTAVRKVTVGALYRKGKMGLYLFALLLTIASQPASALNWGAYGHKGNATLTKPAKSQAASIAGKVAQQANVAWVAYFTKSGTAASAAALLTVWQESYGKFLLTLALIAFMIREYFHYKVKRGNQNLARLTLQSQEQTINRLIHAIHRGDNPTLGGLARPALLAGPAVSRSRSRGASRTLRMGAGRPVLTLPGPAPRPKAMPTNAELLARLK